MIGEVIKQYLVSLGVQIDKPGFNQMQTTLNQTSGVVSSATSGWAQDFVKAGAIISTALASVSASIVGVMTAAAKQDLNMEKYARSMLVSKQSALEMKTAIDALGESVQDIQLTPELMQRYRALVADGRNMKVGGDYEGTMKNFRDLIFEFTRLKQEASYALQWVGYYLMKHLAKPLADAKASFRSFNDNLIKTMPVWTEKVARALVYVINIGKHFIELLKAIGKTIYDVWDAFPRGIKIATAALAAFFMLLRASPLGRMIALVGSLLLLVDDYFGYMEGKQAAMGPVWDRLNTYMDIAKQKLTEWGEKLAPVWESFVGYLELAKDGIFNLAGKFSDWIQEVGQSKGLIEFVAVMKDLGSAFYDLGSGIVDLVTAAFNDLMDSFKKYDIATKFSDLMERLKNILWALLEVLDDCIETLGRWFSEIAKSEEMRDFIDAVVELFGALLDLFNALMDLVTVAFSGFFGELGKTQKAYTFRDAVRAVVGMITAMVRVLSTVIGFLAKFFKMMADNRLFKEFWRGMGQAVKAFSDIVFGAIGMVGKLGQALLALVRGDFRQAAKLAGDAFSGKAEAGERKTNATPTEKEMWELAKQVSKKTGIKPELIYAQWWHESTGFTSRLARENNNFGGVTQIEPNGEENKQPDGSNYYMVFDSPQDYADYYASKKLMAHPDYAGARYAETPEEFAQALKDGGYYTDSVSNYTEGIREGLRNIPSEPTPPEPPQTPQNSYHGQYSDDSSIQNQQDDLRDPTWRDRLREYWRNLVKPSSYITNGFANVDPMLLNGLLTGSSPAYAQSLGSGVTNITYQVDVGGVEVKNTNASADDIGKAVGEKTASSINNRATYVLQNRALNGIQV